MPSFRLFSRCNYLCIRRCHNVNRRATARSMFQPRSSQTIRMINRIPPSEMGMYIWVSAGLGGRTWSWSSGTRSKARKDCVRAESIRDASHMSIPIAYSTPRVVLIATPGNALWLYKEQNRTVRRSQSCRALLEVERKARAMRHASLPEPATLSVRDSRSGWPARPPASLSDYRAPH